EQSPGRALEEFGAERLEVVDDDPDDVRPMAAQTPCHQARLVAEAGDHFLHAAGGGRSDAVAAIDHPGYRRYRDARPSGYVLDGHTVPRARHRPGSPPVRSNPDPS